MAKFWLFLGAYDYQFTKINLSRTLRMQGRGTTNPTKNNSKLKPFGNMTKPI